MPTYQELLARIADHLVTAHNVTPSEADGAARALVRDCGLSTILVKGLGSSLPGGPRHLIDA